MSDNTVSFMYHATIFSKSGESISVRCEVKKVQYNCVWSSNRYDGVLGYRPKLLICMQSKLTFRKSRMRRQSSVTASTERLMKGYKDIVLAKTETKIVIVIENVADFMTESRLSMMQRKVMSESN